MPYIILTANGEEIDRRELTGPLVIGRAPDCDLPVRDILMSRRHCRIEPVGAGWRLMDLGSKNGTRLGWELVKETPLCDGQLLRAGRTWIAFYADEFVPAPARARRPERVVRPADPIEALTGTVTGFVLADEEPADLAAGGELGDFMLSPVLRPLAEAAGENGDDESYQKEFEVVEGRALLLAEEDGDPQDSGSWESVAAIARQPRRLPIPLPDAGEASIEAASAAVQWPPLACHARRALAEAMPSPAPAAVIAAQPHRGSVALALMLSIAVFLATLLALMSRYLLIMSSQA